MLAGALLALWATRYHLSPTWLRVAKAAAALVAIALLLRGVYVELALATDLGGVRQTVGPLETHWSVILWNPWFILGATSFIALFLAIHHRLRLSRGGLRREEGRRREIQRKAGPRGGFRGVVPPG